MSAAEHGRGSPDPGQGGGAGGHLVDTSEGRPGYLLSGRNGAHLRLSPSAYHLLQQVRQGVPFECLAALLSREQHKEVPAEDVAAAYRHLSARIAEIEEGATQPKGAFWFRRPLLPAPAVARIAAWGAFAYHPLVAAILVSIILAAMVLASRWGLNGPSGHFVGGYILFFLSLLAHELGHACACSRYGEAPSEIGFTCYLIYPAFYSNVSAAWSLRRWERVVVDVGGVYFQLVVGAVYVVAYVFSRWEPLRVAIMLIAGSCLFSLNPLLKFDGYWLVADALGVTNLGRKPAFLFRHALARLRGLQAETLPWPLPVICFLSLYSALSVGFWSCFLGLLLPALKHLVHYYPGLLLVFFTRLLPAHPWPDAKLSEEVLLSTYMLVFVSLMLGRLLPRAVSLAMSLVRRAIGCIDPSP